VLSTLSTDNGKVFSALHGLEPRGKLDLMTSLQIAQVWRQRGVGQRGLCGRHNLGALLTFASLVSHAPFQLVLKHRESKNHRQRIVAFVGSPVEAPVKEVR
jgi:26S proteasome regulatory subunit N10